MAPPDDPNAQQVLYWNEQAGPKWVALQEQLDGMLEPFGRLVAERLALRPGERVLDVGCGCGATTRMLAAMVAPGGEAVGIDVSAPMLAHARRLADTGPGPRPTFVEADASRYRAATPFDAIFSRFGVMFFADPRAAFTTLAAALQRGGRLAFACWRTVPENPWVVVPLSAAARVVPLEPPPPPGAPGPFAFGDADHVRSILGDAGLGDVALEPIDRELSLGGQNDLDGATEFMLQMGPTGRLLQNLDAEARARVAVAVREAIAPYHDGRGVRMPSGAWLVTARRV